MKITSKKFFLYGLLLLFLIAFVVLTFLRINNKRKDNKAISEKAMVLKVIDGDTFKAEISNKKETVRIIGVDAPELQNPKECFSEEAKKEAEKILNNRTVYLVNDFTQDDRDKYGRLLRYVFLDDGENFDEYLIKNGFAKEYDFMGKPYIYRYDFQNSESWAKNNLMGLWGACK